MEKYINLITGGNGYLGSQCKKVITGLYPTRQELNVSDESSVRNYFKEHMVENVIHLAAVAKVVFSEHNKELVYKTNVLGTQYMLKYAKKYGVKNFIYLSTACVFSGEDEGMYDEDSIPGPKHYYGWSKLIAEEMTKSHNTEDFRTIVVRTNFTRMPWEYPKAFTDRFGTYLFGSGVALGLKEILENKPNLSVIHLCGDKRMSMYEYAKLGGSKVDKMTFSDYKEGTPLTKNMCLKTKYWKTYDILGSNP